MSDVEKKVEPTKPPKKTEPPERVDYQRAQKPKFIDPVRTATKQRAPKPMPDPVDPIAQTQDPIAVAEPEQVDPIAQTQDPTVVAKPEQVVPDSSNQEQQKSTTQDSSQSKE